MTKLSKSAFLIGRQCARRLWLANHGPPEPQLEADEVWDMREAEGARVEELAAQLFPGAVRIEAALDDEQAEESRPNLADLVLRTREQLAQRAPILQAHLATDDLLAIADVLEPRGTSWFLWEIKASTSLKPIFDWDLAFQVEVARSAGLEIAGAGVIRLNKHYLRETELDIARLLVREDRTREVEALSDAVRAETRRLLDLLAARAVPDVKPAAHCKANRDDKNGARPSACGQLAVDGYCGQRLPAHWIGRLPYLKGAKAALLTAMDPPSIDALDPDDARQAWTPPQQRMIHAVKSNRAQVDVPALRAELEKLVWPVAYVDFEFDTGMAVPRFQGTRPYLRIPFQWSMHVQRARGAVLEERTPFLHVGDEDSRRPFFQSLLAALPSSGSVVVHFATAERTVIEQLGHALGGEFERAANVLVLRLFDTIDLLQAGYYHPDQHGSYSIKKVAPALLGRGYEDLAIQDGMAAVVAWKEACAPQTSATRRAELERNLRAYCGRDTSLMHDIVEKVRELVAT